MAEDSITNDKDINKVAMSHLLSLLNNTAIKDVDSAVMVLNQELAILKLKISK